MIKHHPRALLTILLALGITGAQAQQVTEATAICEVLGDGAKITTAVLSYSEPVNGSRIRSSDFQVEGRQISHATWCVAYDIADVCEWLFRQRRTR